MQTNTWKSVSALLVSTLALPLPLRAEPVTIVGGSIQVSVILNAARITLEGPGFFLRTGSEDFYTHQLSGWPFSLDTPVNMGATWRMGLPWGAEAIFNGVYYPFVFLGPGETGGVFDTPTVPFTASTPGLTTMSLPFTFEGRITAYDDSMPDPGEIPLFSTAVVGSGTARGAFQVWTDPPFYSQRLCRGRLRASVHVFTVT
jgi:hypothetical protein